MEGWEARRKTSSCCKVQINSKVSCQMEAAWRSSLAFQGTISRVPYVCRLVGFAVPVGTVMGSSVPWPHTHHESCNIAVEPQHKHWVKSVNNLTAWMECRAVREKQNQHKALAGETEAHADFLLDALHLPACLVVLRGGFVIRGELSGVFSSAFVLLTW